MYVNVIHAALQPIVACNAMSEHCHILRPFVSVLNAALYDP
jgi:hypothetical protein